MKRTREQVTGAAGILFVHQIVNECRSVFHQIHQEDDLGLDAYVEFFDDSSPSGEIIALQVKTGKSYKTSSGYRIPADREHFMRWANFAIPIAGIVVDQEAGKAFWVNISDFLSQNPNLIESGPYVIPVSEQNEFDIESFGASFRRSFSYFTTSDAAHAADLFFSHMPSERWEGFLGLIAGRTRNGRLVPLILANACADTDIQIRAHAGDALSRYLTHPEVGFYPPAPIQQWAARVIARVFDERTIRLLLECVDENGFERGSTGQSLAVLFNLVPGISTILLGICLDARCVYEVRHSALLLIGYLGLTHLLPSVIANAEMLRLDGLMEVTEWAIEQLAYNADEDALPPGWRTDLEERLAVDPALQPELGLFGVRPQ
jgi:hypothetical protein